MFIGPPESVSEEDTCGSTICLKTSKYLLHLRYTFTFTGPPESAGEEDTHGLTIFAKINLWVEHNLYQEIENNEQGPLIVFELILSYRSVFLRIYVNLILNNGIKSVLFVISSCVEGHKVHVTSKFMA